MKFYSQDGQDAFIAKLFKNKRDGIFLDIGAYDGIFYSNTWYFEKNLGWKGLCIEPNPTVFEKLSVNRNCNCLNCCISVAEGKSEFLSVNGYGEMLSGLVDFFDENHQNRIDQTIKKHGGGKIIIDVPAMTVKTILKDNRIDKVDYCNIDVEGGEMSVLRSIDFSEVKIIAFTIENNYRTKEVRKFLNPKGYKLIARLGSDEVYEYHSKRYGLMLLCRIQKIQNKLSLLSKSINRRVLKLKK